MIALADSKLSDMSMDFAVKVLMLCETVKGHYSLVILFPDRKLTWIFELKLRQTRRLSQSIMDIYGQESQRSMAQFQPEGLSDFY